MDVWVMYFFDILNLKSRSRDAIHASFQLADNN